MIGGIVGGLLFLLVTVTLAIVAVKIFNKRKQREKAMRYGESDTFLSPYQTHVLFYPQAM